eukprot:COSAG02_NODE_18190_length_948_cov_2.081871_1_plen_139_part_01
MDPPPLVHHRCAGARELREVLPDLFWVLVLLGNKPAHAALHGSSAIWSLCEVLWVLAVPVNTMQLAHLCWQVSLGDPAFIDVSRFPLYEGYWLDAVSFGLAAVVFCVQRYCMTNLQDSFVQYMVDDMIRFRNFWNDSSR